MDQPNISVIIPCYDQAQYLEEALQSIAGQTYQNWEVVIVNDGSNDNTEAVAQKWAGRDERIRWTTIKNGGLANARNIGIDAARSELILPLDADDTITNTYLEQAVSAIQSSPDIKVVYGKARLFGARDEAWELPDFSLKTLATRNPIYCSAVFRKTDWERVGGYDLNMRYGFEDWEFWIALLKNGGDVIKLDEVCFNYRISEGSMLRSMTDSQRNELFDYMSKKHTDFYISQLGNFQELARARHETETRLNRITKSNKWALNTLSKNLFNFRPFKKLN